MLYTADFDVFEPASLFAGRGQRKSLPPKFIESAFDDFLYSILIPFVAKNFAKISLAESSFLR